MDSEYISQGHKIINAFKLIGIGIILLLIIAIASIQARALLTDGYIDGWEMDDAFYSPTAQDTLYKVNASYENSVLQQYPPLAQYLNYSVNYTTSASRIDIPDITLFDSIESTQEYTFNVWTYGSGGIGEYAEADLFIQLLNGNGGYAFAYNNKDPLPDNNVLRVCHGNDGDISCINLESCLLTDINYSNDIRMVTIKWNSTTLKGYFDGIECDSVEFNHSLLFNNAETITIGRPDGQTFYGQLDSFNAWNRSLTDGEVSKLYQHGRGLPYPFESCIEDWIEQNSSCQDNQIVKEYYDNASCGSYFDLPMDNGSYISDCGLDNVYINACGTYNLSNSIAHINISYADLNPCIIFDANNVTIDCINVISGDGSSEFMRIEGMNDDSFKNCRFTTFGGIYNIALTRDSNNNLFKNLSTDATDSYMISDAPLFLQENTVMDDVGCSSLYSGVCLGFGGVNIYNLTLKNINITASYTGMQIGGVNGLKIQNAIMDSGTIFGLYMGGVNDAIIERLKILNYAILPLVFEADSNILMTNSENERQNFGLSVMFQQTSGTTFNSGSINNLGWFSTDASNTESNEITELTYYNGTEKAYYTDGYSLFLNKSKEFFISPECIPSWELYIEPCIDQVSIKDYHDLNDCDKIQQIPSDNSTYGYCQTPPIQSINTVKIDNDLYLHILMIFLIITTFIIGVRSSGVYKLGISISGALLIGYGLIFHEFMIRDSTNLQSLNIANILMAIFIIVGLIMAFIGIAELLSFNREKRESKRYK